MNKYFKGLLLAFLGIGLITSVAWAAQNLKQKDTGAAVFEDTRTIAPYNQAPAGDSGLTVHVTDFSDPMTTFVVSGKSGFIRKIFLVANGNSGPSTTTVNFYVENTQANTNQFRLVSSGVATGYPFTTIQIKTSSFGGWVSSITFPPYIRSRSNWVTQGSVIGVQSDGAGTSVVSGTVTIVIE